MKRLFRFVRRKGFLTVLTFAVLLLPVLGLSSCASAPSSSGTAKATTSKSAGTAASKTQNAAPVVKMNETTLGTIQINYIDMVTTALTANTCQVSQTSNGDKVNIMEIPWDNGLVIRQLWEGDSLEAFSEALWLFVVDQRDGKLGTKDNLANNRSYNTVQGKTEWIDPSSKNLLSTEPQIDLGYIVTGGQAYFQVTQRDEVSADNPQVKSPRVVYCISVDQAKHMQELLSNFSYDVPTMVFLGDNVTVGTNAATPDGDYPDLAYPAVLKEKIKMAVINSGSSWITTDQAVDSVTFDVLRYDPAIVVINLGLADFVNNVAPSDTGKNLQTIIDAIKQAGDTKIYLVRFYDENTLRNIMANEDPPLNDADQTRLVATYNALFSSLSTSNNIDLITNIWSGLEFDDTIGPDGINPTADGQKIMAGNFYRALLPYLQAHGFVSASN